MSSDAHPLGKIFALLTKSYLGAISVQLAHLDIERHYYLIFRIGRSERPQTQKELGEIIFQDKSAMVRIVDYLVEKGYVRRKQNTADRREHFVVLTKKGEKACPDIEKAFLNVNKSAFKGLSNEQISCLNVCLDTISANLGELPTTQVKIDFKRKATKKVQND